MSEEPIGSAASGGLGAENPARVTGGETELVPNIFGVSEAIAGTMIGSYRLTKPIGQGGMGEVWLAEQTQPVHRLVAVKLIKAGMDTREVVARFESERQALALMDHPAIAKVFDGGSTPQGRPYFVMEYVTGVPITDYCDRHKRSTRRRLELFIQVCEGVQHAHLRAILHRDLKPSNILVSEVDGRPAPKIIDFGVAKATEGPLTDDVLFTRVGALIGTPGYMSPEQADSAGTDVDTRTDVYSLGAVLYQLLVGALPLDFRATPIDQVSRKLRDEEPARPSTKVRTGGDPAAVSENRGADPPTLARQLRGDLDAITLKALEKDRALRYATPAELAADLQRYLDSQPVSARNGTAVYQIRKYVRRHRVGVVAAAGLAALLISAVIAQTLELRRVTGERDRADRATEFMTSMFRLPDRGEARGHSVRAREILDRAAADIDTGLAKDPELQAQLMQVMADVYYGLGLWPSSESLARRAVDVRRRVLGAANPGTLQSMHTLVRALYDESRETDAEKLCRETLEARRRVLGPDNPDTLESARTLGNILNVQGRYVEAEAIHRQVVESAKRALPSGDKFTTMAMTSLAIDLDYEGNHAAAERTFREVLETDRRRYGSDHPYVLNDMINLGASLELLHRYAEAEKLNLDLLQRQRRVIGPEHPDTLLTMGNLALVLSRENRNPEAEKLFRDALKIKLKVLGPEHRSTLVTMGNLADVLTSEKKYAEAERLVRQTLETERRVLGPEHFDTLTTLQGLGELLASEKRYAEAEKTDREALEARRRILGDAHSDTALSAYDLACALAQQGKRDDAFSNLHFALDHGLNADLRAGFPEDPDLKSLRGDPRFAALVASTRPAAYK